MKGLKIMGMKSVNRILNEDETRTALAELNSREDNAVTEKWSVFAYGYFISSIGRVYNYCTGTMIKTYENYKNKKQNYHCFEMCVNGIHKKIFVHMAVYHCFGKHKDEVAYTYNIFSDKSAWVIHHISVCATDNRIENLYLMLKKWHTKLHAELRTGKIKLSDVDTAEKLDQWVILNTDALTWFTDEKNKYKRR